MPTNKRLLPGAAFQCACACVGWTAVTDALTGTMYARCKTCGRHWLASRRGYVDWSAGVLMDSQHYLGSEWTKTASAQYFGDPSEVTQ